MTGRRRVGLSPRFPPTPPLSHQAKHLGEGGREVPRAEHGVTSLLQLSLMDPDDLAS